MNRARSCPPACLVFGATLAVLISLGCPGLQLPPPGDGCQKLPATIDISRVLSAGCYEADQTVTVTGATLTLDPGVTIYFAADAGLTILSDGSLIADGTAGQPIVLTSRVGVRGAWNGVHFSSSGSTLNLLDYVTIQFAGGYDYFGWAHARSALVLSGTATTPTQVQLSNCTLQESGGSGLFTDENVAITTFTGNTLTMNTAGAAYTNASVLSFLDSSSTFSGNDVDRVQVAGDDVATTQNWAALDVPYVFAGSVTVHAALSISPGATLQFRADTGMTVFDGGTLSAIGSAAAPITFTGEAAAPGSWNGLYFSASQSPLNQLTYAVVEYAGGYKYFGWDEARTNIVLSEARLAVTDCTIRNSEGWGVWIDNESDVNGDVETVNTFSANVLGNVYFEPS